MISLKKKKFYALNIIMIKTFECGKIVIFYSSDNFKFLPKYL